MRKIITVAIRIIIVLALLVMGMNAYVCLSARSGIAFSYNGDIIDASSVDELKDIDPQCILVLGCAVWENDQPSPMLRDRLDTAIALYNAGAASKLLFSGDNSVADYSEPDCMLQYALEQGVPAEDIFLDFAGFSTYDSMYRAKDIFCADRIIVVTQKYHMYRALRIGRSLGIEAKGVSADQRKYSGRYYREAREVLARDKDLVKCILRPEPTFLGDKIPLEGDGGVTQVNQ